MVNNDNIQDELDDLKSVWKSQKEEKPYGRDQIFQMIHKRSVNSVQWLFIISIIELVFGIVLAVWTLFSGKHFYSQGTLEVVGKDYLDKFEMFTHLGLIGSILFMGIIFYYFRKISSKLSVTGLIKNIINFRKTVIWFLVIWLGIAIIIFAPIYYEIGKISYINSVAEKNLDALQIQETAHKVGIGTSAAFIVMLLLFCGLYYLIIYGFFIRKLNKNLKELKKIE